MGLVPACLLMKRCHYSALPHDVGGIDPASDAAQLHCFKQQTGSNSCTRHNNVNGNALQYGKTCCVVPCLYEADENSAPLVVDVLVASSHQMAALLQLGGLVHLPLLG